MKAEIIEQEKSPKASLFIDNDNTIIIMAQEVGNFLYGTVCFSNTSTYPIGCYCENWCPKKFTVFYGKIILSN